MDAGSGGKTKKTRPLPAFHTDKSRHFRWSQDKIHDVDTIPHRCADYSPIAAEPAAPEISLLFSRSMLTYGIIAESSGFFKGVSEFSREIPEAVTGPHLPVVYADFIFLCPYLFRAD